MGGSDGSDILPRMDKQQLPATLRRFAPIIEEYWKDSDGHWAALKGDSGLCFTSNPQCHTAREDTLKELASELIAVEPCKCRECRPRNSVSAGQDVICRLLDAYEREGAGIAGGIADGGNAVAPSTEGKEK